MADADGSGTLDFGEFLGLMDRRLHETEERDEMREVFRLFDKDNDGFISPAELRHVMLALGEKMSVEEAQEMVQNADFDADGKVNFEDFRKILTNKK
ncbi:EF-hand-5 domain-containing protein [Aphelenchoides fujianensis]|nr:EF-hand-5 domain-containing protein [Aphelenchoides fujianensis]